MRDQTAPAPAVSPFGQSPGNRLSYGFFHGAIIQSGFLVRPIMNFLKLVWKKWRAFGQVMGDFVARIIMTVFYFTVALPFGIVVRLAKDPLHLKSKDVGWLKREEREETIESARRLY